MCLMYYKFQGPLYLETVFVSDAKVLEVEQVMELW